MKRSLLIFAMLAFYCLQVANGQWTTNGNDIYNSNTGNVGIGNSTPSTLFYVAKSITEPTITIRNLGGPGGATYSMIDDVSGAFWKFKATNTGGFKIRDNANGLDVFIVEPNSAANAIYINGAGSLGIGTPSPHSSALIDLSSTSKGLLPPRLTFAELNSITSPANGLLVYCLNCGSAGTGALSMFMDGNWYTLSMNCLIQSPSEGVHVPSDEQIIWSWNSVTGALGYRWNEVNDFNSAEEMGTNLSKTESGLSCNTSFTRYVWSYNSCGNSTPVTLSANTTPCTWTCGSSFSRDHVAGNIAPVTKTVTYGTATNILGETSKCWITSNLGADNQASSVNDASEASAGWYWQFNHMQGYKHDGATLTPPTSWVSNYNENSNWLTDNDPCKLLLGTSWRLPTSTEWNNVITGGGWSGWEGPWNSALKMHASGYLQDSDGQVVYRGVNGVYWSSIQSNNTLAQNLLFYESACFIGASNKANGFNIRCLQE